MPCKKNNVNFLSGCNSKINIRRKKYLENKWTNNGHNSIVSCSNETPNSVVTMKLLHIIFRSWNFNFYIRNSLSYFFLLREAMQMSNIQCCKFSARSSICSAGLPRIHAAFFFNGRWAQYHILEDFFSFFQIWNLVCCMHYAVCTYVALKRRRRNRDNIANGECGNDLCLFT